MTELSFRSAELDDCDLLFNWANDPSTRQNSYNSEPIKYVEHVSWYKKNISERMLIFFDYAGRPVGITRLDYKNDEWIIGITVDGMHRGKGYSVQMLKIAVKEYSRQNKIIDKIIAYIKVGNEISKKAFVKAGFEETSQLDINNIRSYKMCFNI